MAMEAKMKKWNIGQRLPGTLMEHVAAQRGIEDVDTFIKAPFSKLEPPGGLPGALLAASRIKQSIVAGDAIWVYGDYDVDGITATSILYRCLSSAGANVHWMLPNRIEGYGLHASTLELLKEQGCKLLITVDCGIAAREEAKLAKELGITLIVTDHHHYDELPDTEYIVHPSLTGSTFPHLCGAGVALKVAWALSKEYKDDKVSSKLRSWLMEAVQLAAIGTIADVVPLIGDNRTIVKNGLNLLYACKPVWLKGLLDTCDKSGISSEDIAFGVGPKLNAVGRLSDASLGVKMLLSKDEQECLKLAKFISEKNEERKLLQDNIEEYAHKQIAEVHSVDDKGFVVASPDWHRGVVGIVAGRLAEHYHRPVVVVSAGADSCTGSGRSPEGIPLRDVFAACSTHLIGFGGHSAAAGMRILPENIPSFRAAFAQACAAYEIPEPYLDISTELKLQEVTLDAVEELEKLAPFGMGHPRPLFCSKGVELLSVETVGSNSLRLHVQQDGVKMRGVAFRCADKWDLKPGTVDIAYRVVVNEWRGRRSVDLHVVDYCYMDNGVSNEKTVL